MEEQLKALLTAQRKGQLKNADFEQAIFEFCNQYAQVVLRNALQTERIEFIRTFYRDFISKEYGIKAPIETIDFGKHLKDGTTFYINNGVLDYYEPPLRNWFSPKGEEIPTYDLDYDRWIMDFAYNKAVEAWNKYSTERDKEARLIQQAQKAQQEKALKEKAKAEKVKEAFDGDAKEARSKMKVQQKPGEDDEVDSAAV